MAHTVLIVFDSLFLKFIKQILPEPPLKTMTIESEQALQAIPVRTITVSAAGIMET